MKKEFIWLRLISKRLLKNPVFMATLLLIPAIVLSIRFFAGNTDSFLRVAVYTSSSAPDTTEQMLVDYLLDHSGNAVTFYQSSSESELREDVKEGYATCGYIIPASLDQKITRFQTDLTPVLKTIRPKNEFRTKIIDELVYSGIYSSLSFDILTGFVNGKIHSDVSQELENMYNRYLGTQAFFEYEMSDGSENKILNHADTNYMLLPIRGMTAVLLLLAGMTGTLFWYEDREKHLFTWLPETEKKKIQILYLLTPALLAGTSALLSISLTGISSGLFNELLCMSLYLFAITAFCHLLSFLLPKLEWMLAAIPLFTAGSLIVCPVFINLSSTIPVFHYIQKLIPVTYYLNSLYSIRNKWILAAFGIVMSIVKILISICKTGLLRHRVPSYMGDARISKK